MHDHLPDQWSVSGAVSSTLGWRTFWKTVMCPCPGRKCILVRRWSCKPHISIQRCKHIFLHSACCLYECRLLKFVFDSAFALVAPDDFAHDRAASSGIGNHGGGNCSSGTPRGSSGLHSQPAATWADSRRSAARPAQQVRRHLDGRAVGRECRSHVSGQVWVGSGGWRGRPR